MDNNGNLFNQVVNNSQEPGKNHATAAFVLGIISVALPILSFIIPELSISTFCGLTIAIVGVCIARTAAKKGNSSSLSRAGMILSIVGIVMNSFTVACTGCAICTACAALPLLFAA